MSDVVIRAEGLGKKYLIGHQASNERYVALRDVIAQTAKSFARSARDMLRGRQLIVGDEVEEFWALKDLNFEVRRGDVVGIIGHNGAGKSTLLKILSRITEPSAGCVEIRGRVASLLEVGTGFHPELTGSENIFLNGAILGMSRAEIKRKFEEIVAFAEIEKFLDTPVKRYSSGMYVRLAFAVAAHLEPEILIVDEVLAVGDAEFQKKCLGKMSDVAAHGRTVLFVSHNMTAIERLCSFGVLLEAGRFKLMDNDVRSLISLYLRQDGKKQLKTAWVNTRNELNHSVLQPLFFGVVTESGQPLRDVARNDEQLFVKIVANIRQANQKLNFGFSLLNGDNIELFWSLTTDVRKEFWPEIDVGLIELRCPLPKRLFNEGVYRLELIASIHFLEWIVQPRVNSPVVYFTITGGLSESPFWLHTRPGVFAPEWRWTRVAEP